jgi:hypothetical protein
VILVVIVFVSVGKFAVWELHLVPYTIGAFFVMIGVHPAMELTFYLNYQVDV